MDKVGSVSIHQAEDRDNVVSKSTRDSLYEREERRCHRCCENEEK
jgi:hypothetical protein